MELRLVEVKHGKPMTTSLKIAEVFGKDHKRVLQTIRERMEDKIGKHEIVPSSFINSQNKEQPMYLLDRDCTTFLIMGFTGDKANEWKWKYIEAFNEMEQQIKENTASYMIQDPIERAKAWIEEQKEKEALLTANKEMQPKAIFADAVSASNSAILVGELAKIIKQNGTDMGQNRLFTWLRDNQYLISRKGTDYNMPTQRSMELGLFTIKETAITHSDGSVHVSKTVKVTGKGQQYFINRLVAVQA